jgi:6-phosphogluconolactonase
MGNYAATNSISRWSYGTDRTLKYVSSYSSGSSPSWLAFSSDSKYLYATNEYPSTVSSFSINQSGDLSLINTANVPSGGVSPCHLSVDPQNRFVLVVSFFNGVLSQFPLSSNGAFQTPSVAITQNSPSQSHLHNTIIIGGYSTVIDLGLDHIMQYSISSNGVLSLSPTVTITSPTGTGPRHIAFHPTGNFAIVINQLGSSLTVVCLFFKVVCFINGKNYLLAFI